MPTARTPAVTIPTVGELGRKEIMKIQAKDICYGGALIMFGHAIKQTIKEYRKFKNWKETKNKSQRNQKRHLFEIAEHDLFHKNGLEAQIKRLHLDIDIGYIRKLEREGVEI